ncbi:serine hydrolase domain-containing protein [Ruania zhangjianzhongii]|uniref:serine hydrolase domain-containing protein n=1 Tax=Ruania zhangjianzhongii TaxID=2603206 RepID=UPI00143D068D|nr:serine hydrolase domain-containing protein [Ruania zhangjianzhongii]
MSTGTPLQARLQDLLDGATSAAIATPPGQAEPVDGAPGAAALIAHRGEVLAQAHSGWAVAFAADGRLLPEPEREPVRPDQLWDVASVTKLFTAVCVLAHAEAGVLDLDRPVAEDLPEFAASDPDRARVLPRHLLTHTAGLPSVLPLWRRRGSRDQLAGQILRTPLLRAPGEQHEYSCVGYLTLGLLLERRTGRPLPELVQTCVTGPLGMADTGYTPPPGRPVAATEYQHDPARGLVRGQVHDETAWALGGAGNAGIFSTPADLLRFAEEVRTGAHGLLGDTSRTLLRTGTLTAAETARIGYDQAIGFRLGQESLTGSTEAGPLGHSGFTGTAVVIDPGRELVSVLLSNRVHPRRESFTVERLRAELAGLARTG